jgi:4-aminobutyrate--pyruvate transaminase
MVNATLQNAGVISRALGDATAFCPPLIITESQVDTMVGKLADVLDEVAKAIR